MTRDPSIPAKQSLWRRFMDFKTLVVSFSLVGLLASNVASLVSASAHDRMHNALWRVLSIGGQAVADRALANSPKARVEQTVKSKTADLEARNKQLKTNAEIQAKELDAVNAKNRKLAQQIELNGKQAKDTVGAVHKRIAKGISRNLASIPSEAVPFVGIGVTLAMTTMDIYDACQTMKDFNTLLQAMGQGEENPDLCGQKVPTREEVIKATCVNAKVPYLCSSK